MFLRLLRILVLSPLLLGACGIAQPTSQPQPFIALSISGGLGGVRQELSVFPSGHYVARDDKRSRQVTGQLPPKKMDSLRRLATALPADAGVGISGRCADCFNYRLSIQQPSDNGAPRQFRLRSDARSPAPLLDLISQLQRELRQALDSKPGQ